jgi:hypothetical protein
VGSSGLRRRRGMTLKYAHDFAGDAMALFNGEPSTYPSIAGKQQRFAWRLWRASASGELRVYLVWYLKQLRSVNASVRVPGNSY